MRVLVVGATGFLGSWTVRALLSLGAEVSILTRIASDTWRLAPVLDRLDHQVIAGDEVRTPIQRIAPDVLLSLDWAGVAGADRDDPSQWDNLDRLRETVRAAADAGATRVIGVGSQAEYGPRAGVVMESDPAAPVTEYGRAKAAASSLFLNEALAAGLEGAWVRVFSTFGPLDHPYWVLPQLAARVLRGERAPLTDGTQRWSYLTGSDAGLAFARLATVEAIEGIYNLGNPEAPPLRTTIEAFARRLDRLDLLDFGSIPHSPTSVMHLQPEVSRLMGLGWAPRTSLADGLTQTADWILGREIEDPILAGLTLPAAPWGARPPSH